MKPGVFMKFFPLKIVVVCLILTPLLYIVTISASQKYLDKYYLQAVQNIMVGDARPLLNGTIHLEEQIAKNIEAYRKQDFLMHYTGLEITIQVTTAQGKIIYPLYRNTDSLTSDINQDYNSQIIANKNFELLNHDLTVKAHINLNHGSKIANIILFLYSALSLTIFFIFYKISSSKAARDRQSKQEIIQDLKEKDHFHQQILEGLKEERQGLFENIKVLNTKYQADKEKTKINEEEMFEEILSLEEQLNTFIELKKSRENEIDELKSTLQKYERRKGSKIRRNEFDFLTKLFSVLYKNIEINRKALTGLIGLGEEQQIKAEEIIHQLDQTPENVIIKRKVFSGKKHKTTCLEVLFAYNGRLYFRKLENRIEVVVIGTKNTQPKDMEFLHSL
jgi:large-conductance mechanosensitive channel